VAITIRPSTFVKAIDFLVESKEELTNLKEEDGEKYAFMFYHVSS